MQINKTKLITLRQRNAWSQQQVADISGLSLRTIQRIEKNGSGSNETLMALASAFDCTTQDLISEAPSRPNTSRKRYPLGWASAATALIVFIGTLVLPASAEPVMMDVAIRANNNELTRVHLLTESDDEAEIMIAGQLKLILTPKRIPDNRVRLLFELSRHQQDQGFVRIATPSIITGHQVPALVRVETDDKEMIEIEVTPDL